MSDNGMPARWYYRRPGTDGIEGPLDFVEMAGMLAAGDVQPETLTREGTTGDWRPFQQQREFHMAKEMPPCVIIRHLDAKAAEHKPFNPFRWLYQFLWLTGGVAVYTMCVWLRSHFPFAHQRHDSNDWLILLLRWLLGHHDPHQ